MLQRIIATIIFVSTTIFCGSAYAKTEPRMDIAIFPKMEDIRQPARPAGPEWMHNAVFYQIYPQAFCDSDGDGIGDLRGIISKLDYVKSLGVTAIWLNPFYESPFRDAGYDVSDYRKVAPRYGTNEDAKELFRIAHEKGLRVIIDFVAGHTSKDHPWFKASSEPTPNKYSNWYIWTSGTWFDGMDKYRENFIQGYSDRNGNYMSNFFWHQPALNYGWGEPDPKQPWQLPVDHPDVLALREEMKSILRFWLDMGCDGFRCDMAGSLVKNDPNHKIRFFWQDVRKMLDEQYPNAFLISEWSDPANAIDAGFHADFMHWVPTYNTLWNDERGYFEKDGDGDVTRFLKVYYEQYLAVAGKGYISLPVGNHDITRINNRRHDATDIRQIYVFQFTIPNVPFIYYGDEIGMRQLDVSLAKEGAYGSRAGSRTPMQWDGSANLGFSNAPADKLYFPVDSEPNAPTVAAEESDPNSLLNFVRQLVKLKKDHPALEADAAFVPIYARPNMYPLIFLRSKNGETLLIAINPNVKSITRAIKGDVPANKTLLMGSGMIIESLNGNSWMTISGRSFAIYKLN